MRHSIYSLCVGFSLFCFLSMSSVAVNAEVFYKWKDDTGHWVYGAHAPPGVEVIEVQTSISKGTPSSFSSNNEETTENSTNAPPPSKEAAIASQSKMPKAKRNKLCQQARKNIEALSGKAVIRQRDADGNVTVLSEDDRQVEMDRSQLAIDEYC